MTTKGYRTKRHLRNLIGKWRGRANARNISFVIASRWKFHPYQFHWFQILVYHQLEALWFTYLVWQLVFNISFNSSQHEGFQDHMKSWQLIWNTNIGMKMSWFSLIKNNSFIWNVALCVFFLPWSIADLFSAWFSISFENHSLNSSCESKRVGIIKCSKAHSCGGNEKTNLSLWCITAHCTKTEF